MPVSKDLYVSYRSSRPRVFGEVAHRRALTLVDLGHTDTLALRRLPLSATVRPDDLVVVRGPDLHDRDDVFLKKIIEEAPRWDLRARLFVLDHPIGQPPRMRAADDGPSLEAQEVGDVLRRARALELEALLNFGAAIWRPAKYHFRLPTGEHSGTFVRIADAIREPRDAAVLAGWLLADLDENTGLFLDTGTLTALTQAVELEFLRAGRPTPRVAILDEHARTATDLGALIDDAAGLHGGLLAVVSVSSSGSLVSRLRDQAIGIRGESLVKAKIAVLVDKGIRNPNPSRIDIWTPLEYGAPLVERLDPHDPTLGCSLCRSSRAPLVSIDPRNFEMLLPSQFDRILLDLDDPRDNRPLWDAANRTGALSVEQPPVERVASHRIEDKAPMPIKLDLHRLIVDPELVEATSERIAELTKPASDESEDARRAILPADHDLVLVADHEADNLAFEAFWPKVSSGLCAPGARVAHFTADEPFSEELTEKILAAKKVLVFALGTVTGGTLQRGLVGVQTARTGHPRYSVSAFVLHARPASWREWRNLRNAFNFELFYGWLSILPDRSPLRDEARLLTALDESSLSPTVIDLRAERLALCGGTIGSPAAGDPAPEPSDPSPGSHVNDSASPEDKKVRTPDRPALLWGQPPDETLTPNSILGQGLRDVPAYVAVGSAMAASLKDGNAGVPVLRVFDVSAVTRSYFDPMIICCFLRWLRPHECFWGWTPIDSRATARYIINRADQAQRRFLIPEMLLAAAQGKLTAEAAKEVRQEAERMRLDKETGTADVAFELALALGDVFPDPAPAQPTVGS